MKKIWINIKNYKIKHYILAFFSATFLTACSGSESSDLLVGTWVSNNDDMVVFEEDGTCSAPFTYNASWIESADHYALTEDGTLVFSSEGGHANDSYEKADDEEQARDKGNTYYVSGNTLIIEGKTYTKSK